MMATPTPTLACDSCGQMKSPYGFVDMTVDSGTRGLCNRCFNEEAARLLGIEDDFQYADLEPVVLRDAQGDPHEFHFRTFLHASDLLFEAAELADGVPRGYVFAVSGMPGDDPLDLLQRVLTKARLGLSRTHVVESELGPSLGEEDVVRGRIEWDDESQGRVPLLIVDGRPLSWDQLGTMLMTYEGFDFKLEIMDTTEAA